MFCDQVGHRILHKTCVDSTNEEAKRDAEKGAAHGTVYWADRQTEGKGRRGRSWISQDGSNLYFTVLLRPTLAPEKITMLTLVMAYAVALAIEKCTGLETGIKWPNDIVVNGKKVCGILSEMKMERQQPAYCVVGVGINIGQTTFPKELRDKATSLCTELQKRTTNAGTKGVNLCAVGNSAEDGSDKEKLLQEILKAFEDAYQAFLEAENLLPIWENYNGHLVNRNRQVRVLEPGGEYEGTALGISPAGELLVEKSDKTIQKVYAGEVSVRGLYGYV